MSRDSLQGPIHGPIHGPIRRIPRERLDSRDEVRLPAAWVGTGPAARPSTSTGHLFPADPARTLSGAKGAPVLVMLHAANAAHAAVAELLAPASAGERVYVLAPAGWAPPKSEPRLLACRTVLIRRVPEVPAAGVYRAGEARLWMGTTPGGEAPWCLRLDAAQAESFRQLFLRLFWHHATDEGWTGGTQLSFRPAGERPFDIPEPSRAAPLRLLGADERPTIDLRGTLVYQPSGTPPEGTPRRLWFPASGSHHAHLIRLVGHGSEVVWEGRDLPDLVIGKRAGLAWLPGIRARLLVELNPAQAADAAQLLEGAAAWQFRTDIRLGYHAHDGARLWLDGAAAAHPIEPEQVLEVPEVQAESLRTTPAAAPASWPPVQPLALRARYRWTALPPRLPPGSEEDPLVGRWRQLDEEWSRRRGELREVLQEAGGHRGRLGKAFVRLVSALLGFDRTERELLAELDRLDPKLPSAAGPAAAPGLLRQLLELEDRARRLQGDLEEAERKAQEEEERTKQERAWRDRVETARRELPEHRTTLTTKEAELPALTQELDAVEAELQSADKKAKKDLQARKQRASDDLTRLRSEIKRLQSQVADLEQRAEEGFDFKPAPRAAPRPAQGAGRFVPQAPPGRTTSAVPDEALPTVGSLRRHRGQRCLVIERWEDLQPGEQDASRLKARLVAPENP